MKAQLDKLFKRSNSECFPELFSVFYDTYRKAFACYAYSYSKDVDDASSAANDALIVLWKKLENHHANSEDSVVSVGWLFTVTKRKAISFHRKRSKHPLTSLDVEVAADSRNDGINEATLERYIELTEGLAENDPDAWLLLSEHRDAEAARFLGIPDSTYRAKKKQWVKEIRSKLESEGISYPAAIAAVSTILKALPETGTPDFLPTKLPEKPLSSIRPRGFPIVKAVISIAILALAISMYLFFSNSETPFTWSMPEGQSSEWQFNNDVGPMGSVVVGDYVYVSDYISKQIVKLNVTTGEFAGKFDIAFVANDIDYDPKLQIFYIRSAFEVVAFNEQFERQWVSPVESTEWMYYGLCVDSKSNIHVPTGANNTIVKLAPDGKLIGTYKFNPAGDDEGAKFIEAMGGSIFVSAGKRGVFKLSEEGAFIERVLEGEGDPAHLCKLPGNRTILHYDAQKALKVFDSNWNEIAFYPMTGHNGFKGEVVGLSADSSGNLFISEGRGKRRLYCINLETILNAETR